jgi:L-threonylcarbamoyladenylate synthase
VDELLGIEVALLDGGEVRAPGTLESHYAPRAEVEVAESDTLTDRIEAALARGERVGVIGVDDIRAAVEVLGVPHDSVQYAHDLYRMLRDADARGLDRVIAVVHDATGLGAAVADRLRRAAGSR